MVRGMLMEYLENVVDDGGEVAMHIRLRASSPLVAPVPSIDRHGEIPCQEELQRTKDSATRGGAMPLLWIRRPGVQAGYESDVEASHGVDEERQYFRTMPARSPYASSSCFDERFRPIKLRSWAAEVLPSADRRSESDDHSHRRRRNGNHSGSPWRRGRSASSTTTTNRPWRQKGRRPPWLGVAPPPSADVVSRPGEPLARGIASERDWQHLFPPATADRPVPRPVTPSNRPLHTTKAFVLDGSGEVNSAAADQRIVMMRDRLKQYRSRRATPVPEAAMTTTAVPPPEEPKPVAFSPPARTNPNGATVLPDALASTTHVALPHHAADVSEAMESVAVATDGTQPRDGAALNERCRQLLALCANALSPLSGSADGLPDEIPVPSSGGGDTPQQGDHRSSFPRGRPDTGHVGVVRERDGGDDDLLSASEALVLEQLVTAVEKLDVTTYSIGQRLDHAMVSVQMALHSRSEWAAVEARLQSLSKQAKGIERAVVRDDEEEGMMRWRRRWSGGATTSMNRCRTSDHPRPEPLEEGRRETESNSPLEADTGRGDDDGDASCLTGPIMYRRCLVQDIEKAGYVGSKGRGVSLGQHQHNHLWENRSDPVADDDDVDDLPLDLRPPQLRWADRWWQYRTDEGRWALPPGSPPSSALPGRVPPLQRLSVLPNQSRAAGDHSDGARPRITSWAKPIMTRQLLFDPAEAEMREAWCEEDEAQWRHDETLYGDSHPDHGTDFIHPPYTAADHCRPTSAPTAISSVISSSSLVHHDTVEQEAASLVTRSAQSPLPRRRATWGR